MRIRFLETWQAEAEAFARMVDERGQLLRTFTYDHLRRLADEPTTEVLIGKRKGRVSIIVEQCEGERVKVVVQGFLDIFPGFARIQSVALHGFYKGRDGTISEMRNEEYYAYD